MSLQRRIPANKTTHLSKENIFIRNNRDISTQINIDFNPEIQYGEFTKAIDLAIPEHSKEIVRETGLIIKSFSRGYTNLTIIPPHLVDMNVDNLSKSMRPDDEILDFGRNKFGLLKKGSTTEDFLIAQGEMVIDFANNNFGAIVGFLGKSHPEQVIDQLTLHAVEEGLHLGYIEEWLKMTIPQYVGIMFKAINNVREALERLIEEKEIAKNEEGYYQGLIDSADIVLDALRVLAVDVVRLVKEEEENKKKFEGVEQGYPDLDKGRPLIGPGAASTQLYNLMYNLGDIQIDENTPKEKIDKLMDEWEKSVEEEFDKKKSKMKKSGYQGYSDADNVRRKQSNIETGQSTEGAVGRRTKKWGGSGVDAAAREAAALRRKSKKNPVKEWSPEEIAKLNEKIKMEAKQGRGPDKQKRKERMSKADNKMSTVIEIVNNTDLPQDIKDHVILRAKAKLKGKAMEKSEEILEKDLETLYHLQRLNERRNAGRHPSGLSRRQRGRRQIRKSIGENVDSLIEALSKGGPESLLEDLRKNVLSTDKQGSAVETGMYSNDLYHTSGDPLMERIRSAFPDDDYSYGLHVKEFMLNPKYKLVLSHNDKGVYSGHVKGMLDGREDGNEIQIEKQTLPTLIQFLKVKEIIDPKSYPEEKDSKAPDVNVNVNVVNQQIEPEINNPKVMISSVEKDSLIDELKMRLELGEYKPSVINAAKDMMLDGRPKSAVFLLDCVDAKMEDTVKDFIRSFRVTRQPIYKGGMGSGKKKDPFSERVKQRASSKLQSKIKEKTGETAKRSKGKQAEIQELWAQAMEANRLKKGDSLLKTLILKSLGSAIIEELNKSKDSFIVKSDILDIVSVDDMGGENLFNIIFDEDAMKFMLSIMDEDSIEGELSESIIEKVYDKKIDMLKNIILSKLASKFKGDLFTEADNMADPQLKKSIDAFEDILYGLKKAEAVAVPGSGGKGEGSRGGKIIGHDKQGNPIYDSKKESVKIGQTRSGKDIFDSRHHESHADFDIKDANDAYDHHTNLYNQMQDKFDKWHEANPSKPTPPEAVNLMNEQQEEIKKWASTITRLSGGPGIGPGDSTPRRQPGDKDSSKGGLDEAEKKRIGEQINSLARSGKTGEARALYQKHFGNEKK